MPLPQGGRQQGREGVGRTLERRLLEHGTSMPDRPPVGALTNAERRADSDRMADPSISITDLRVDGQAAVFTIDFTGAPELEAESYLRIYDAATRDAERRRSCTAPRSATSDQHSGSCDLPADELERRRLHRAGSRRTCGSGMPTRREMSVAMRAEGRVVPGRTRAGVPVDRGRARHRRGRTPIMIENMQARRNVGRLRPRQQRRARRHRRALDPLRSPDGGRRRFKEMKGREVVNGKATQSAHHLLPEALPDGSYTVYANSRIDGAQRRVHRLARLPGPGRRPHRRSRSLTALLRRRREQAEVAGEGAAVDQRARRR